MQFIQEINFIGLQCPRCFTCFLSVLCVETKCRSRMLTIHPLRNWAHAVFDFFLTSRNGENKPDKQSTRDCIKVGILSWSIAHHTRQLCKRPFILNGAQQPKPFQKILVMQHTLKSRLLSFLLFIFVKELFHFLSARVSIVSNICALFMLLTPTLVSFPNSTTKEKCWWATKKNHGTKRHRKYPNSFYPLFVNNICRNW